MPIVTWHGSNDIFLLELVRKVRKSATLYPILMNTFSGYKMRINCCKYNNTLFNSIYLAINVSNCRANPGLLIILTTMA